MGMKGQINIADVIGFFIALMLFFVFAPMIEAFEAIAILGLNPANPYYSIQLSLIYITNFIFLLGILVSIINKAVPRQEPYYGVR